MLITCLVKDVKIEKSNEQKQTQEQKSISNTPSPRLLVSLSQNHPLNNFLISTSNLSVVNWRDQFCPSEAIF